MIARTSSSIAQITSIAEAVGPAVVGAMACAAVLHLASDRSDAAWIVPIALAWGVWAVVRGRTLPDLGPGGLLFVALMVRFPLVGVPLHLSDDLYRYLWEGRAVVAGHDVFVEAPSSIAGLDDALRALVNHPDIPSVYPPLALAWFVFLGWLGTPSSVQLATALVDATVPVAIRSTGRVGAASIYVLHPLPALESAAGGHVNVPAVALAALGSRCGPADAGRRVGRARRLGADQAVPPRVDAGAPPRSPAAAPPSGWSAPGSSGRC